MPSVFDAIYEMALYLTIDYTTMGTFQHLDIHIHMASSYAPVDRRSELYPYQSIRMVSWPMS